MGYFGRVEVGGTLFWVGDSGWDIILGGWKWVGHYFGWVAVSRALFWVGGGGWG